MRRLFCFIIAFMLMLSVAASAQVAQPHAPGDRITSTVKNLADWIPAALPKDTYRIGPGDVLAVNVQGKANLNYLVNAPAKPDENPNEIIVTPGGQIFLPLVGEIQASGKTVVELQDLLQTRFAEYFKNFTVSVSVSKVRTVNIWISGEVESPGPQVVPAVSTVSLAALQAGIKPTGSTRRITLIRGGEKRTVDLYEMAVTGSIEDDIPLEPGDGVHVPPVTDYVSVTGEVTRPGQYETIAMGSDGFCVSDLVELALGTLPSGALDKCYIERIGGDGKKFTINLDLRNEKDTQAPLIRGDNLVIPSISAFQPMIRLIGEFKGDGVYQRTPVSPEGASARIENVQNKSGIYFLKQGQTVMDVITVTGGVTPQADLRRAHIDRVENGAAKSIPVDLDRLLINGDKSADVALVNGDSLILPALADKVHVFGEVKDPASYVYGPNRRLIDYLGDAGGPTQMAKLTDVSVVRGTANKPQIMRLNAKNAMRGTSSSGNPVLEPGDIVYVPSKIISGWRDVVQLIFTSLSLNSLLKK
jgi:protein involved in polysaccharide export with SLBB domain